MYNAVHTPNCKRFFTVTTSTEAAFIIKGMFPTIHEPNTMEETLCAFLFKLISSPTTSRHQKGWHRWEKHITQHDT
jgi:hypothetical protein